MSGALKSEIISALSLDRRLCHQQWFRKIVFHLKYSVLWLLTSLGENNFLLWFEFFLMKKITTGN